MRSFLHSSAGFPGSPHSPPISYSHSPTNLAPVPLPPPILNTRTDDCRSIPSVPLPSHRPFFTVSGSSHLLSSRTRGHVSRAIQNGWATSTIKRYSSTVEQFIRFCDLEQVPDHLRFPADEFVLCAFAASSLGKHSRSTPSNRLSALKAWHIAHNVEWKGSSRLRYVLNGVHTLAPSGSKRPPRPPINARMLTQLVENLDLNSYFDVAVAACAVTAFWGQCRLGELIPSSSAALLSTPFPIRSSFVRSVRNPKSCFLHLPHTKTHLHGQDIVLVDQRAPINPISLLKIHLRLNNVPNDGHIFSYTSADGPRSLTKSSFLRRCNEIWQLLGYPRTTGHCFRIGGTTELLIAGTPPDVVKTMGRWSSDSFLRYWRSLDDIAPQHVRFLHTPRNRPKRQ
jgi:hypothetical protein